MSLIVAGVAGNSVWMVSDTAISGGTIGLRERDNWPKIEASHDGMAVIGFAGDKEHGSQLVREAGRIPAGMEGVEFLRCAQGQHPNPEFAYAYIANERPYLFHIADERATEVPTLHLGSKTAFEIFQKARHSLDADFADKAVKTLVVAAEEDNNATKQISNAIAAMLSVFADRNENDVGGWAVPYLLSPEGAFFCSYGYSVTDPILDDLAPGSLIPHGTVQAGGFGLSVTNFQDGKGMVVYWLQKPGGTVIVRNDDGYFVHEFDGAPTEFKEAATAKLGGPVDLWFGGRPTGPIQNLGILRDDTGRPSGSIADHGDTFSFAILNVTDRFHSRATIPMNQSKDSNNEENLLSCGIGLALSKDGNEVVLQLAAPGQGEKEVNLTSEQVDALIWRLAVLRASLTDQVPTEPPAFPGAKYDLMLDPVWRTEVSPHPHLGGILLKLRHIGFGWLHFILPHHEAGNLGKWLVNNARRLNLDDDAQ